MSIKVNSPRGMFQHETENFTRAFSARVMYQAGATIRKARDLDPESDELEQINSHCLKMYDPMSEEIIAESLEMLANQITRSVKRDRALVKRTPVPTENDVNLFTAFWIERAEYYGAFLASEVLEVLETQKGED